LSKLKNPERSEGFATLNERARPAGDADSSAPPQNDTEEMTTRTRGRSRAQALLDLQLMKEHHRVGTGGGRLRAAIFGINDGLVTNASLVVGVAAAEPGRQVVILAGIAGLVAGAFSMAAGEYISMSVQREVFESQIDRESRELRENPAEERAEVSTIFRAKGLPDDDAERIAEHVMNQPDVALDLMAREELGLNPDDLGSPWGAASSSFLSFAAGAAVPLLPYIVLGGVSAMLSALVLAGVVIATVGALTARLSERSPLFGALRALLIGAIATGVTYIVGRIVGVAVT
jgi:vacuolar iron transporter family protein